MLEAYPDSSQVMLAPDVDPTWREGYILKLHPSLEVTYVQTHWNGTTNITIKRKKDNEQEDEHAG